MPPAPSIFWLLAAIAASVCWLRFYWDAIFISTVFFAVYGVYFWQLKNASRPRGATDPAQKPLPHYPFFVLIWLSWECFLYLARGRQMADWAHILQLGAVFLILPLASQLKTRPVRQSILWTLCLSAALYSLFYILYSLNIFPFLSNSIEIFINHNALAAFLIFALAAAAQLFQEIQELQRDPAQAQPLRRRALSGIFIILFIAFILTQSRLAFAAAALMLLLKFSMKPGLSPKAKFSIAVGALGLAGVFYLLVLQGPSFDDRRQWWQNAWTIFLENPIVGRGGDAFLNLAALNQTERLKSLYAHSFVLQSLCENGLISTLFLAIYMALGLKKCSLQDWGAPAMAAVLLQSLFDLPLNLFGIFLLFWIFAALFQRENLR